MCLCRDMEWAACLVEFHLQLKLPGQPGVGLRLGQAQGALRRFHRFGKPPGFGQGGGEGVENDRILLRRSVHWPAGPVPPLCRRCAATPADSGQEPGQIILDPWIGWFELQRHLKLGDRFAHASLLQKSVAKVVVRFRVVWLDLQRLLEMGDRFVHSALLAEERCRGCMWAST